MPTADNFERLSAVGSGETVRVHIPWSLPAVGDLYIWLQNNVTGELLYNADGDFTIDPAEDLSWVDILNPYWDEVTATGEEITAYVLRQTGLAQTYTIPAGPLNPKALVAQFDKVARQIQELAAKLPRTDVYPVLSRTPQTFDSIEAWLEDFVDNVQPKSGYVIDIDNQEYDIGTQDDRGKYLHGALAGATVVRLQAGATPQWEGHQVTIVQLGDSAFTILAASGVKLNGVMGGSCRLAGPWCVAVIHKISQDNWHIYGGIV